MREFRNVNKCITLRVFTLEYSHNRTITYYNFECAFIIITLISESIGILKHRQNHEKIQIFQKKRVTPSVNGESELMFAVYLCVTLTLICQNDFELILHLRSDTQSNFDLVGFVCFLYKVVLNQHSKIFRRIQLLAIMEALYFETNRLIQDTQNYFQQLNNVHTDTSEVESSILRNIAMVNAYVNNFSVCWLSIIA